MKNDLRAWPTTQGIVGNAMDSGILPFKMAADDKQFPRELSQEEIQKLRSDTELVPEFKQNKLEKEAQRNWDCFYKRNSTNFFKDRHWTTAEFRELLCSEEPEVILAKF